MNFSKVALDKIEEYVPKVHYIVNDYGGAVLCDTKNAREGTEDEDKVTCLRCKKRLEQTAEIVAKGNVALIYNVSVDSPRITQSGKKILQAWLNTIPDNVKLTFNHDYNKGNTLTASWTETRKVTNESEKTTTTED